MKRLSAFIIKSYLGPLLVTFFIGMFVLIMQFLWKYIDEMVGKGLESSVIAELLFYASGSLVVLALPLAVLLSSIMTFGTLGENNELIALKSAGLSLTRIMRPLYILVGLITLCALLFAHFAIPYTNLKTGSLLFDIRHQRPQLDIKEGSFNNDIDGYSIKVGKKNNQRNMMYDFMLYDHTHYSNNSHVTIADSATMYVSNNKKYMILTMYNGINYEEMQPDRKRNQKYKPHRTTEFEVQRIYVELKGFKFEKTDDNLFKHNHQMKNLFELTRTIDSLDYQMALRKDNFIRSLLRINYFKHNLDTSISGRNIESVKESDRFGLSVYSEANVNFNDTLQKRPDPQEFVSEMNVSIDSIMGSLDQGDVIKVAEAAKGYANSALSYIKTSNEDFHDRIVWIRKHEVEWHKKFSYSVACFILFFIGAPLGAIIRKGGFGIPILVSVLLFITYYMISLVGEKFVREDMLPAYIGMWLSTFIITPLGLFLTYKASNDSTMLKLDAYKAFFKKLFSKDKD